ncbi:transposase [Streptomyces sp. NBC_00038]|uniref:transposase n=1 Tax=Streptomyces sp. NBC_00038 TaxID=2903615 RepID=UPI00224F9A84|nr:transposase [Streptomyces sp. NBC_00038]MCX5557497.1 transposase [Streptomyces sp. NBC_00038]
MTTESGPVALEVPRDRDGSITHRRSCPSIPAACPGGDLILSLPAKGLTHGEISAWVTEVYGAEASKPTITDKIAERLAEWQKHPLDEVHPVLFIDALHVRIRDGQVAKLWASDGAQGAKYWQRVLTEIKTRGVRDTCIVVCDGLKVLPDAIDLTWPEAIVQTCLIHLIRYAGRQDWAVLAHDLKPIYAAVSEAAALEEFAPFADIREQKYPAITKLWERTIESLNARLRRAVRSADTSPAKPPPSNTSSWPSLHSPRKETAEPAGLAAGNPPSTPSSSPS